MDFAKALCGPCVWVYGRERTIALVALHSVRSAPSPEWRLWGRHGGSPLPRLWLVGATGGVWAAFLFSVGVLYSNLELSPFGVIVSSVLIQCPSL